MNIFNTLVLPVMMSVVSADVLDTGQQVVQELRKERSKETTLISFLEAAIAPSADKKISRAGKQVSWRSYTEQQTMVVIAALNTDEYKFQGNVLKTNILRVVWTGISKNLVNLTVFG